MFSGFAIHDVYLFSIATILLALFVALYFTYMFKERNDSSVEPCHNNASVGSEEHEGLEPSIRENYKNDNDGIVGKIKTARLKSLEAQLTNDQLEEERRVEREQLAAIFELLKKQETELNVKEIDENELSAQLNLYR